MHISGFLLADGVKSHQRFGGGARVGTFTPCGPWAWGWIHWNNKRKIWHKGVWFPMLTGCTQTRTAIDGPSWRVPRQGMDLGCCVSVGVHGCLDQWALPRHAIAQKGQGGGGGGDRMKAKAKKTRVTVRTKPCAIQRRRHVVSQHPELWGIMGDYGRVMGISGKLWRFVHHKKSQDFPKRWGKSMYKNGFSNLKTPFTCGFAPTIDTVFFWSFTAHEQQLSTGTPYEWPNFLPSDPMVASNQN